jgi:predicted metalloprotease
MKWTPGNRSTNLEDRRGASPGGGGFRMGGGGLGGGRMGLGGLVILVILSLVFKQDLTGMLGGGSPTAEAPGAVAPINDPKEEPLVGLVSTVLDSAQAFWRTELPKLGGQYQDARLVLFRDATETACGFGQAASGPFYCPPDQRVYIDLGFFQELSDRFRAPGDFAAAYVLAHEIGHHVQNLLGVSDQVHRAQQGGRGDANQLSVRLELQADCYAGVWAHSAAQRQMLDPGDVEEGLAAAAAVGDDRLQRMSKGTVNPESWTHGSSAQRSEWFKRGLQNGDSKACDTFSR